MFMLWGCTKAGRGCGKTRNGRGRARMPGRTLAAGFERADDLALGGAVLFFAARDLAIGAGLGRVLPLPAFSAFADAAFACFFAFPFERLFFRADMVRLLGMNVARQVNVTL